MNACADNGIAGASIASRRGSRQAHEHSSMEVDPVIDSGMKGRVKGLLAGPPPVTEFSEQMVVPAPSDPDLNPQRQALQVLTLAQRTADEHVANAHRQADKICADARATAERTIKDAVAHADDLRAEADKKLSDARAAAEKVARDGQAQAEAIRRDAEKVLVDARTRAEEVAKDAQADADELKDQAQRRYQDVVGTLAAKREALQQQIEALEQFDRDYRGRLTSFMQGQLRALWVDEPQVDATEIEQPGSVPTSEPPPALASH